MSLAYAVPHRDLTPTERRVLRAIYNALQTGFMPTGKEIATAVGHSSRGAVVRIVERFEARGLITRDPYKRWRSIQFTDEGTRVALSICSTPSRSAEDNA